MIVRNMRDRLRYNRIVIGRALIHLGLRVMPKGPARSELYSLFDRWTTHVENVVHQAKQNNTQ